MIELKIATKQQVQYACKYFHYAKLTPPHKIAFSVFEGGEWCGCVLYGLGGSPQLHKQYKLPMGKVFELQRMALNGKQSCTSKILALSIKMVKKNCKNIDLLVSFADSEQGHTGVIYQATNWIYENLSYTDNYYLNGKKIHSKNYAENYRGPEYKKHIEIRKGLPKYKYIYPLNEKIRKQVIYLAKEYPKPAVKAFKDDARTSQFDKAVVSDLTAQNPLTDE
jgi:hypothetical protein